MADLVQELREYLLCTSKEQVAKDWENLSSYGKFGPDVFCYLESVSKEIVEINLSNRLTNPEFSLDFFIEVKSKYLYGTRPLFS